MGYSPRGRKESDTTERLPFLSLQSLSHVRLFRDPPGPQPTGLAPLSMGFSKHEYWSGVPLPSPDGLPFLNEDIYIFPGKYTRILEL